MANRFKLGASLNHDFSQMPAAPHKTAVIPGRANAANPETMNTGLCNMDLGSAAARHPGMTSSTVLFLWPMALDCLGVGRIDAHVDAALPAAL